MPRDEERIYRRAEMMLQTLLGEEFKLRTHRETREYPVYAMVVANRGAKLKKSEAPEFDVKVRRRHLEFHRQSMSGLVRFLYNPRATAQPAADRPVVDRTGLDGLFDFVLDWTQEPLEYDSAPGPALPGPSIFTAMEQQLGLKLQPGKAPIKFLVIDHAEKPAVR
jgi:uncharacterized protein (TIGR03435 family)